MSPVTTGGPQPRMRQVVVVTGGDPVDPRLGFRPSNDAVVIAADSGLDIAVGLGFDVDLVVGDMDSVDPVTLDAARAAGARIEQHPEAKDRTDLGIALDAALHHAPAHVVVVGGHGGRLDHFLANALLLASDSYRTLDIVAHLGEAHLRVVRDQAVLEGRPGELVSLLPAHGSARGVTTRGLRFPLNGEDLPAGTTRGVSNEFAAPVAHVAVREGVLLAVQPRRLHGSAGPGSPGGPAPGAAPEKTFGEEHR